MTREDEDYIVKEEVIPVKNKTEWSLLPWNCIEEVAKVQTFGATKHGKDSWKDLNKSSKGYDGFFSAAMRHIMEWESGSRKDKETGLHPLSHAICNLLYLMWHDKDKSYMENL